MKGKLIKRTIIASLLVSSLAIAPISSVYANENDKPTKQEQTTEKAKAKEKEKEEKAKQETNQVEEPKQPETQSIPEPPSGENVVGQEEEVEIDIDTPASVTGERMEGNGTVVDFSTSGSKAFYTIVDDDQQVFYLIIDMDKTQNNVYFLSEINRGELSGVTAEDKNNVAPTPPNGVEEPEKEIQPEKEKDDNNLGFLLTILILGGIGAVAYYFLVIKKKQNKNESDLDEDEMSEDYEDDFEEDYLEQEEETENNQEK